MATALVELPEPVVRLAPCPQCADRRRTLVESAEGMRGHCLGCRRLLSSPLDSTAFESYGEPGPGSHITIYANSGHVYMVVDGRRFDTVAQQEGGSRWSSSSTSTSGYVERHPAGY